MGRNTSKKIKKTGILKSMMRGIQRHRLGELLVMKGLISKRDLRHVLRVQKETQKPLGRILVDSHLVSQNQLRFVLGKQFALRACASVLLMGAVLTTSGKKAQANDLNITPVSATQEFQKVSYYPALLGTSEKRDGNLSAFTKWTGMFKRFEREIRKPQNAAILGEWQADIDQFQGKSMKQMVRGINRLMNNQRYILDQNNWGKSDYWATPVEFLKRGGDCEDFAIAKYAALRSLGMPEERLRVAIVQDTVKNIPHAVLVAYTDEGAYILDNQIKRLVDAEASGGRYKPIFSINRQAWWLHTAPSRTIVASVD